MKSAKIKLSELQDQLRDQNPAYQKLANVKLAHVDHKSQRCQSMQEHSGNVACFSSSICELPELKSIVELAGFLHDAGKLGTENQADFRNILERGDEAHQYGLDHSTAGGRIALELLKGTPVSEFISMLIYFHHGLEDCINLEDGQMLQERRLKKEIEYSCIKESFLSFMTENCWRRSESRQISHISIMLQKIGDFVKNCDSTGKKYGSRYFYLGMYLRVALSLLIDGDWTDTGCFFQDIPIEKRFSQEETQRIWKECICNFEQYMENEVRKNPDQGNQLNDVRQEISDSCQSSCRIRGKTISFDRTDCCRKNPEQSSFCPISC
ncbi:MAG: CRISPR-associated endonuclease Cas3'' [Pilosibacter sp.]